MTFIARRYSLIVLYILAHIVRIYIIVHLMWTINEVITMIIFRANSQNTPFELCAKSTCKTPKRLALFYYCYCKLSNLVLVLRNFSYELITYCVSVELRLFTLVTFLEYFCKIRHWCSRKQCLSNIFASLWKISIMFFLRM